MRAGDAERRRLRTWAIAAMATVALGVIAVAATYTPLFAAKDIRLEGAGAMPRAVVLDLAGVDETSNVFHLDTGEVERRLEADPRVLHARVTTSLPDALRIEITRRSPVAVVGTPRALVGADGIVIGPASGAVDLPALTSAGGHPATGSDLETTARAAAAMGPELRLEVTAVTVRRDGGLAVRLSAGFWAHLGDASDLGAKAASLAALLDWAASTGANILSADVTVPGSPTARVEGGAGSVALP